MLLQANLVAIITLFSTYVLLFGLPSVQKYYKKGVIIIKEEENPLTVIPPGISQREIYKSQNEIVTLMSLKEYL